MADFDDPTFDPTIMASATRFLVDGHEEDAASVLLSCELTTFHKVIEVDYGFMSKYFDIILRCQRNAYDLLVDCSNPIRVSILRAFEAVVPYGMSFRELAVRAEFIEIDPLWHTELLEIARGRGVTNQLADQQQAKVRTWNNLRFRSQSEVRVAAALDRSGVFFLPNCKGRLTTPNGRENREADFLVCMDGKWGILEVDGEPFHPPSRTVHDHERDRLFKAHGILVVEHFDASECFENAQKVVSGFLDILRRS